jgi:transcriptional regulator with XRE-family HTH domain
MNQGQMADLLGISQNYLSLIESQKKQPSAELISTIAEKLKISNDALVFAASDIPSELDNESKKVYKKLQENIISLLLFQTAGELDQVA